MREIRDKIAALSENYRQQLALYRQIGEVGSQEAELISTGQLARLLDVLREKEQLLKRAGEFERQIKQVQEQLVSHFELPEFSLPRLKLAAPEYYQAELADLERVVAELVPVLEQLEARERANEAALSQYMEKVKPIPTKAIELQRASRAYGKQNN